MNLALFIAGDCGFYNGDRPVLNVASHKPHNHCPVFSLDAIRLLPKNHVSLVIRCASFLHAMCLSAQALQYTRNILSIR
jgi:hypothetical protein